MAGREDKPIEERIIQLGTGRDKPGRGRGGSVPHSILAGSAQRPQGERYHRHCGGSLPGRAVEDANIN